LARCAIKHKDNKQFCGKPAPLQELAFLFLSAASSLYICSVEKLAEARLPVPNAQFTMIAFGEEGDLHPHIALVASLADGAAVPLVRVHSECMTGDVFGSTRCDCGQQLDLSLDKIGAEGGCLIYLRQEGRGIGLVEKMKAYNLQDEGMDTIEANEALGHQADARSFDVAAEILRTLGMLEVRLLTNNPKKVKELEENGIRVEKREPVVIAPVKENEAYLAVKKAAMGHWL
jgi:GTP cyclohydrolase II